MADHTEDNDPFEEDIVFDQAGLLGGKMPRSRQQSTVGFLPTFMLFIRTVFLCIAFIGLGLCASVSGGPLIRLEIGMGVPVDTAFHIFTARSVGTLLGGLLGSLLFDVYNRQFLMFVSLVWVSVSVTVLPFTVPTALWWTFTTNAAVGMGLGFLFTGGNVLCLDLWGRQGGASLQSLHFSFAVGAFIAPLVIHPFFVGLHPAEIHNLTEAPAELTSAVPERAIRAVSNLSNDEDTTSFNITSLSFDNIRGLTLPSGLSSEVNSSKVTILQPIKDNNESVTSGTSVQQLQVTPVSNSTTSKPVKMKPSFTDGNDLKPDSKTPWKKGPSSEDKQTYENQKSPDVDETKSQKNITTLAPVANKSEILNNTALNISVTEGNITKGLPPNDTKSVLSPVDKATDVAIASDTPTLTPQISPTAATSVVPFASTAINAEPSMTTTISVAVPTTTSTSTTTTSTTTPTTTTTTTTTRKPVAASHIPPSSTVKVIPVASDTQDDVSSEYMHDFKSDESDEKNPNIANKNIPESLLLEKNQVDSNSSIPEPELLDLKESLSKTSDEETHASAENNSGLPSIIHLLKPGTYSNRSDENNQFLDNMAQRFKDYGVTKVHLAYICIGIFIILNALISVVILCHNPREPRSKQDDGGTNEFHKGRMILFIVIFSVFMFMAESLQGAVHHLLASSSADTGLKVIKESEIDGQALFWGLVCLVRFLCILLSGCLRLKPGKLLTMAVLFSIIGSVFLAIGSFGKEDFLWGGIIFMSLGLAPILPTSLLWMAQYMRVTHRMCALMIVLASFGNSLTHTALTHVAGNSHLYAYVLIFISVFSLFFLLVSMCVLYTAQRSKTLGVPIGYQLANQHEEEDSIELTPSGSAVFTPSDPRIRENGEAGQSLLID